MYGRDRPLPGDAAVRVGRLCDCGIAVPVDRILLEEVADEMPRLRGEPETMADNWRFASMIYRTAILHGLLDLVAFEELAAAAG